MPASFSTILDNFDSNTMSSLWMLAGYVSPTFANKQLQMTMAASTTATVGMETTTTYDLTGTACSIQLVDAGPQTFSGWAVVPIFILKDFSNELYFQVENGFIAAYSTVGGVPTALNTVTYSNTNHQFLRIRESSGTIYWDTSANGISWTNFASQANPFAVTSLYMSFLAETASTNTSAMTALLDNFNVIQIASSDPVSELENSGNVVVIYKFTDTDSSNGTEVIGGVRKILVSQNPTTVGIAGIVDIVYPDFPEFTFGNPSSALLAVAVSSMDSCNGTDSIAAFAFGVTDSSSGSDVGIQTTAVSDIDPAVGSESVVNRGIVSADSYITTDTSITTVSVSDVDSSTTTDIGAQSYAITSMDSSAGTEIQIIGTNYVIVDTIQGSDGQSVYATASDVDSSITADSVGGHSVTDVDSSGMSEAIIRNNQVFESLVGSDFGYLLLIQTDSCITTDQQTSLPAIIGTDSSAMNETIVYPIAIGTTSESVTGFDVIGTRTLISFDSSLMTDVVGNRTLISLESIQESDAGIHGNFVFNTDSSLTTEINNPPVYAPASSDSVVGTDTQLQMNSVSSNDVITLSDNQTFTIIGRDSSILTDTAQTTSVAITATEYIRMTDVVGSRTFGDTDQSILSSTATTRVTIQAIENIQTVDVSLLFVPIAQTDRSATLDNSVSVFAHISDSDVVRETDQQIFLYRPVTIDTIHIYENTTLVENPPNYNANITVTDSCTTTEVARTALSIIVTQSCVMNSTASPFARSSTIDSGAFQGEQQSITTIAMASDSMIMTESLVTIAAVSSTRDSIQEVDNQISGPADRDFVIMADTASVVKYTALDFSVWAYGQVSILQ